MLGHPTPHRSHESARVSVSVPVLLPERAAPPAREVVGIWGGRFRRSRGMCHKTFVAKSSEFSAMIAMDVIAKDKCCYVVDANGRAICRPSVI